MKPTVGNFLNLRRGVVEHIAVWIGSFGNGCIKMRENINESDPETIDHAMDYEISSWVEMKSSFVPINDFKGPLADKVYVKGAIQWRIGEAKIDMEDEMIDSLWCSIIEGLMRFRQLGDSDVIFPSHSLSLRFSSVGKNTVAKDLVRITIGDFSAVVARRSVERSLCEGARAFLLTIRKFKSSSSFDNCLRMIDEIEKS